MFSQKGKEKWKNECSDLEHLETVYGLDKKILYVDRKLAKRDSISIGVYMLKNSL